ncbi:glutamic acid-rich protein [Drosophila ficusphila]|uniref:glutamic acid-rich protein n=1 Tax=Drosophila ficusphila TaxID=30025 RepID=UPI0007E71C54|nr:glutamic acid-rich protein [Drosophila ficusphila]
MRVYLLLALFGCVLLATVSASPVDVDDLKDSEEDQKIAAGQENVEDDAEDDLDTNPSESQNEQGDSQSEDDASKEEPQQDDEEESEPNNQEE